VINNTQNEWVKRQLFNPDTLVLRASDGKQTTVNARGGEDYAIRLPMAGSLSGAMVSLATVDQQITNVAATILFDLDVENAGGLITRSGGEFTVVKESSFTIQAEANALQQQNNSILKIWAEVNGVAIPYSTSISDIGNASTTDNPIFFIFFYPMTVGSVFRLRGITSVANGCSLDAVAAAAPAPAAPAARISIVGYLRIVPP
jgi:hypothetical protein